MGMDYDTRQNYSEFFAQQTWDYFFTGTFRETKNTDGTVSGLYTSDSARRAGQRFFAPYRSIRLGVIFIESGSLYGKVHLHGLLGFDPKLPVSARTIWADWYRKYGYARVEIPESRQAVSSYCTKYCTKHMKDETYIIL